MYSIEPLEKLMSISTRTTVLWTLLIAFLVHVVSNTFFRWETVTLTASLTVFFLVSIAIIHGMGRYTGKQVLIYFVIAFIVSNIYENVSILTGFPFGHYHYTDNLGPKLFLVPLLIAPAYIGAGYLAWTIAHVLLGVYERKLRGADMWAVPLIASFVMVMWDLAMDPKSATIGKSWIWHDGGSYFGVPFINYMGWLLCVYTIFQLFALYLTRTNHKSDSVTQAPLPRSFWYQTTGTYAILTFLQMVSAITESDMPVTDATGQIWQAGQIYTSMALVATFTMGFVVLLSMLLINRKSD